MNALRSHSYILIALLCFLVLFIPTVTFANDTNFFQGMVYTLVTTITGWFLGIGGLILNYGINDFLLGFGRTFGDTGIGLAVNTTWTTIRDFVNMAFIFGLVYIGFKMILDSNDSQTKKWIANLVLAALLINFSLLITKGVIEVSNQFAIQIIESGFPTTPNADGYNEVNMSANLMNMMGITTALSFNTTPLTAQDAVNEDNAWGYIFGNGILFMVSAFVFAAGGILLIIRFAILNFYMVLSPVLFLGFILPPLQGSLSKYWSEFLKKCFFAPVYILMLYFSFQILDGMQRSQRYSETNMDWGGLTSNSGDAITNSAQSTIPFFILTCFFLIGSLIIANKMSADGSAKAMSIGKSTAKWAGNKTKRGAGSLALGAPAKLAQGTVGAVANAGANSRRFQTFAASNKIGRAALGATRKVADSSFDARRVGGAGKALGIGEGKKGGFKTRIDNRTKNDEAFMKSLDNTDMEDPENIRRADELAATKSNEANQMKAAAEQDIASSEQDEAIVAALTENDGKTFTELDREIASLSKEIDDLTTSLNTRTSEGTITTQERTDAEKAIAEKTEARQTKGLAYNELSQQARLNDKARSAGYNAAKSTDPVLTTMWREQQQSLEKDLAGKKDLVARAKAAKDTIKTAKEEIGKADEQILNAQNEANNEIKFESKLAFMDKMTKDAQKNFRPFEKDSLNNLQKKFGKNASQMAEKNKQTKQNKDLAKQLAQLQKDAGEEAPAKEAASDDNS